MYRRILTDHIPLNSFFLFGPRQTGKSTLLNQLNPIWTLDLLDPEKQLEYSKDPKTLYRTLIQSRFTRDTGWIVLDEIQRVPALLDVVQMLMQERPNLKFALSGSSARKLKRGTANLLGGRAAFRTIHPLTYSELENDFAIDQVLSFGTLPKIYSLIVSGDLATAQDLLKSYVITYLSEEIKAEALVRNLQGFQNFLEIAATQFSEQVNLSNMEKDCRVSYSAIRDYYSILEDTMIGFFLQPYLRSKRKRMSHAPKFYFFDNGVIRAVLGLHRSHFSSLERGKLWEQWFIQEVVRINAYLQKEWTLSFWRTSHGAEVDLLIERGREILCAIEIKSGKIIADSDLTGIRSFCEEYPKVPCFVAGGLEHPQEFTHCETYPAIMLLAKLQKEF
ncbi:MAG: ATP-binding protein [Deltaproteobacteria bacterium]|nr:ATP-binding protein [Deltaproteobacteria bacterium]